MISRGINDNAITRREGPRESREKRESANEQGRKKDKKEGGGAKAIEYGA